MKLVKRVEVSPSQTMAIYELSPEAAEKHGKSYLLSKGEYREGALKKHDDLYFVSQLSEYYFEGLFETEAEAYLSAKLVWARVEIERLNAVIRNISETELHELKW